MPLPVTLQEAPVTSFTATEAGMALLEGDAALQEAIAQYSTVMSNPEDSIGRAGGTHVGMGDNSQVWNFNGVAIKASSPTTGRNVWRYGISFKPEDLLGQFVYLDALGRHLDDRTQGEIITPAQHFALRTKGGNYLLGQQFMDGWTSLGTWTRDRRYDSMEREDFLSRIQARIVAGVGYTVLRPGVVDLHLGRRKTLHVGNVLIPKDTTSPETARLCIIDQPSQGLFGRIGVLAARAMRQRQPKLATASQT